MDETDKEDASDSRASSGERDLDRNFKMWKEQEAIAMHFNDLIARFRVQALGGTATIGAVAAAVFAKSDATTVAAAADAHWTFVGLLAFLFVAWAAIWRLDYGYYKPLLNGAVKSIAKIELLLPTAWRLSSCVEAESGLHRRGHLWFYTAVQLALLLLLLGAVWRTGPSCTRTLIIVFALITAGGAIWLALLDARATAAARPAAKSK